MRARVSAGVFPTLRTAPPSTSLGRWHGACSPAPRPHLAAIEQRLRTDGTDVDGARRSGRYIGIDAEQLLPQLLQHGIPTADRYNAIIGTQVDTLAKRYGGVRAFGELVQLLWRDGK